MPRCRIAVATILMAAAIAGPSKRHRLSIQFSHASQSF